MLGSGFRCTTCVPTRGGILNTESFAGSDRSRMACVLAIAGKSSVKHTTSGAASSKKRRFDILCKKDLMCFIQFLTSYHSSLRFRWYQAIADSEAYQLCDIAQIELFHHVRTVSLHSFNA